MGLIADVLRRCVGVVLPPSIVIVLAVAVGPTFVEARVRSLPVTPLAPRVGDKLDPAPLPKIAPTPPDARAPLSAAADADDPEVALCN